MSQELDQIDEVLSGEILPVDGREVPHNLRRTYDIKQLWERHHEIMNLHSLGYKGTEIAKILCIEPQTVSNTINSSLGKIKEAELREIRNGNNRIRLEQINILTDKALAKYYEVLESDHATLKEQIEVADTVVKELSGLRQPLRVDARSASVTLTGEDLERLKARGFAVMKEAGLIAAEEEAVNES